MGSTFRETVKVKNDSFMQYPFSGDELLFRQEEKAKMISNTVICSEQEKQEFVEER